MAKRPKTDTFWIWTPKIILTSIWRWAYNVIKWQIWGAMKAIFRRQWPFTSPLFIMIFCIASSNLPISLPCPNHWSKENLFTERFFLSSLYGLDMRPSPRQPLIHGFKANIPNDAEEASRILHQLEILSSIYYEGIIDPWKYQNKVIIHSKNVKPFEEWRFKLLTQFKDCSDGPLLFQNVRMFQIRPQFKFKEWNSLQGQSCTNECNMIGIKAQIKTRDMFS